MDADDQAAIAAVRRYAQALERIRSRLFDAYPEFQGRTGLDEGSAIRPATEAAAGRKIAHRHRVFGPRRRLPNDR